jgi:hypothetical protein
MMVIILKNNNRLKNLLASDGGILFRRILIWAMMMIWIKIHKIKIKSPIKIHETTTAAARGSGKQ